MKEQTQNKSRLRAYAMILGVVLFSGCFPGESQPQPEPTPESIFETTARQAYAEQAGAFADQFQGTAAALDSGEIETEKELHSTLKTRLTEARRKAVLPIDQMILDEVGGKAFSKEKASRLMREIGKGFRHYQPKEEQDD